MDTSFWDSKMEEIRRRTDERWIRDYGEVVGLPAELQVGKSKLTAEQVYAIVISYHETRCRVSYVQELLKKWEDNHHEQISSSEYYSPQVLRALDKLNRMHLQKASFEMQKISYMMQHLRPIPVQGDVIDKNSQN
jgi:hypothetical protein